MAVFLAGIRRQKREPSDMSARRSRSSRCVGCLLALALAIALSGAAAISVELTEVQSFDDISVEGEFENDYPYSIERNYGGVDPIETGCGAGWQCNGLLTRDGSLELASRYGCVEPFVDDDDDRNDDYTTTSLRPYNACGVTYDLSTDEAATTSTISAVSIAFHPDSVRKLRVFVDETLVVEEWEGLADSGMQSIPGLEGAEGQELTIQGITESGDYLGILEVEIYIEVDEVEVVGVSASSRLAITASATTDSASAMNTLDGDITDSSSWTCSSGEVCEITYDLEAVESLEQLRLAFSTSTDSGGTLRVMAAGESGDFVVVREGLEAGGRPAGTDGLQTFGAVRCLGRYVKIEATPASGGIIGINEVEFRVGEYAPKRPVAEKPWLKEASPLPAGREDSTNYHFANYNARSAAEGGCDSPGIFEGCHVVYIKDGDMSEDSRWSCGPSLGGNDVGEVCIVEFGLNIYRYVRQLQIAFHLEDGEHVEFAVEANTIEAYTASNKWATVVPSAIASADTEGFQTFNVGVFTNNIRVVPKFKRIDQTISIKEVVILEKRKKAFIEGTVPISNFRARYDDDDEIGEARTRFKFDIPAAGDEAELQFPAATVSALRLRFPSDRTFVFDVEYSYRDETNTWIDASDRFTSAGGNKMLEEFTLSRPTLLSRISILAVEGPTFENKPWYPTLRVNDLQLVGERFKEPNTLKLVSTAQTHWGYYQRGAIPDIVADGVADQQTIMTAICEAKGATYDGMDCVGELDDTPLTISMPTKKFYLDGPVFLKSGVILEGHWNAEHGDYTEFVVYEGPNSRSSGEDAVVVIDGAIDAEAENIKFSHLVEVTGPIIPGSVGNLWMDVRDSQALRFNGELVFSSTRLGAARFADSSNITAFAFWVREYEAGNFLELTGVSDFYIDAPGEMPGLLIDSCTNVVFEGAYDTFEIPNPGLFAPTGGDQTANVVITGDSSDISFINMPVGPGNGFQFCRAYQDRGSVSCSEAVCHRQKFGFLQPRILLESTAALTLDAVPEYEDALSGDCIVQVPEGSTEDILVQINSETTLVKSGNCFVMP